MSDLANQSDSVALMSIHPEFAEAILTGKKKVEFRKRDFTRVTREIVIYATSPVAAVVGKFQVSGVETLKPATLWRKFSKVGGIEKRQFDEYFEGKDRGVAFRVGKVVKFKKPIPFSTLKERKPPQSFFYLTKEEARKLQ